MGSDDRIEPEGPVESGELTEGDAAGPGVEVASDDVGESGGGGQEDSIPVEEQAEERPPARRRRPVAGLAVASYVCGTATLVPFVGIVALVLGIVARNRIRARGEDVRGAGLATAGVVLGAFGTSLTVLAIVVGFVALPGYLRDIRAHKEALVRANMKAVQVAIEEFRLWTGGMCPMGWQDPDGRGERFALLLANDLANPFTGEIGSDRCIQFERWPPPERYAESAIEAGGIVIYSDRDRYMVIGGGADGVPLVYVLSGGP
ncbi:hypothetical protein AMJ39_04690 [candidate division TA06 bacterium DG_24]|jgi:hypothetical protein|uniref:DUF4190 domain-containing protein n=2 Tax=Bacteria division TA06 TaxID=1156500 RepID=A0A0S8GES7_UNCT6|nr:MAG: hypothetical protein AMJ39_04690 [candidate division TA06 bacterium DG_24]KPK71525.1 MAG: hypothetical protein AMJ82_00765 [candidate division TA06 bacterium SM23_40]